MKSQVVHVSIIAAALLGLAATAQAEGRLDSGDSFVYAKLGTPGAGIGLGRSINERMAVRIGIGGGAQYKHDETFSGVEYEIKNKPIAALEALADWYPIAGSGFRLTGGLVISNAKSDFTGKNDAAGNFSLNGRTYSAATVGDLKGSVKFNTVAPYLGVGWESDRPSKKGWRFVSDAGIAYLGKGRTSLSAGGAAGNAALGQDVEAEKRQLASEFKNVVGFIASAGASYSF